MTAFLRTRYLWCLLCTGQVLCLSPARAQTASATASSTGISITGIVTTTTGESLPGVTILRKGTSRGATTDANGKFTLTVPDRSRGDGPTILTISFVGFVSRKSRSAIKLRSPFSLK